MELKITQNRYVGSNHWVEYSDDLKKIKAVSYGWWQFVWCDNAGNVVFNNANYSRSTSEHQGNVDSILRRLNIDIAVELEYTLKDHGCAQSAIDDEIKCIELRINDLEAAIKKKGSHRRKNEERKNEIKEYQFRINDLKNYIHNYIDKQKIPVKKDRFKLEFMSFDEFKNKSWYRNESEEDVLSEYNIDRKIHTDIVESYAKYFKKPNGKIQTNELNACLINLDRLSFAPQSLDKIINLLSLKQAHVQHALQYRYISDTENMIPADDTPEYIQLQRWVKRNNITRENLNMLSLDKLHTYLINKQNRKEYTPSEPVRFPVNDKLLKANHKHLKLITTDRELRAEGKRQHHCIGSKYYINRCSEGYHALNFKGHTFFLTPTLDLVEAHGAYNQTTPQRIKDELITLIEA